MHSLEHIIELDLHYLKGFSKMETCEGGVLFYNEDNPTYYDANHAHIWRKINNPNVLLSKIKKFYQSKSLIPRLYLYN